MDRKSRRHLMVLTILQAAERPLTSIEIASELTARGQDISERTVRVYLQELSSRGMTRALGRKGHEILERGRDELKAGSVMERVRVVSARIDQMTYQMTFDLEARAGTVVVNASIVTLKQLKEHQQAICQVFSKGYAMGQLVSLIPPGVRVGTVLVPEGHLGFCSVCSITLNGVLLKHGIPIRSRFAGIIELRDGEPQHFVDLIMYDGTSMDPLEIFIRSGMTNYLGAIGSGNGRIGAGFRELPAGSRKRVSQLAAKLDNIGLGGFMTIGRPGQALMGVPVSEGHAGTIVIGGLNPISVLEETGHRVASSAMCGLLEYEDLFPYTELPRRLREFS